MEANLPCTQMCQCQGCINQIEDEEDEDVYEDDELDYDMEID